MAREQKEISDKQFRAACGIGCTLPEIASLFDCSDSTIRRWCQREYGTSFESIYKEFSQATKISVRHNLFQLSKKSAAACIFLARNLLGYSDQPLPEGETESVQAITRLNTLFDSARKRYGEGAASSPEPEQDGAARDEGGPPSLAPAPRPVTRRKPQGTPAKGKAPAKAVKSK